MTEQKFQECCNRIRKLERRVDALENKAKSAQITTTESASQVSYESLYIPKSVIEDIRAEIEQKSFTAGYFRHEVIKTSDVLDIIDKHVKAVEE